MDGAENRREHFVGGKEVVKVGPGESAVLARIAIAGDVDGVGVAAVAAVGQPKPPTRRKDRGAAGIAGGDYAVEEIHPMAHAGNQVFGQAHPHQVARLLGGQQGRGALGDLAEQFVAFAHADAADRVTGTVEGGQPFGALGAEFGVDAALDDGKKRLVVRATVGLHAALHPGQGAPDPGGGEFARGRVRGALVESHDDVGSQSVLNADGTLGSHVHDVAGLFVLEAHALVGDLDPGQGEDLEPAAIGKDGAGPLHEGVEAAEFFHQSLARLLGQVVGVGEHHLGAGVGDLGRGHGFERAVGAHGHEARGAHPTVRSGEAGRPGLAGCGLKLEFERHAQRLAAIGPGGVLPRAWMNPGPARLKWIAERGSAILGRESQGASDCILRMT